MQQGFGSMTARTANRSKRFLFCGLLLGSLCLWLLPHHTTRPLQTGFRSVFQWPLRVGQGLPSLAAASSRKGATLTDAEGHALQAKVTALENQLATLKADLASVQALSEQLAGIRMQSGWERTALVHADAIMRWSPDLWVINRGHRDGLREGLFAISDNAVVGRLSETGRDEARLVLITHKESSIPTYIQPCDAVGKLDGLGNGQMRMRVRRSYDVQVGNTIHVSKLPGLVDVPLVVGRVVGVQRDDEYPTLWNVTVEPAASLQDIKGVSVVRLASES